MPCQTQTSQQPQQPTTVLPQNLPKTQADWQRFLQRMNELLGSINNAQYATGVNAVPTEYAVYDGTALPALRITGATSAFDTAHAQFGVGSLQLTATASTVTVELAASGYPITLHPNWKWIASLFLLTSATSITGKLSVVTPAKQYDVDISGSPGASWSRLYGDYDLTADASTSCALGLTLTGVTIGQVFNVEGWMLEPSQGAVLPSPFIMTSGPRTWNQVVGSDAVNTNITTAQTTATTANTTANQANTTAQNLNIVNLSMAQGMLGWTSAPTSEAANWYGETGTNGPNGGNSTYIVHKVSGVTSTLDNTLMPCYPGQVIKASGQCKGLGSPNGAAGMFIAFYDINKALISAGGGNSFQGNGTYQLSAYAVAPPNAAFVTIGPSGGYASGTPQGYYSFANFSWNYQPSTVDEVLDGKSYARYSAAAWAPEIIQNANFLAPADPQGNIPGWSSINSGISIVPAGGPKALQVILSGTGVGGAYESHNHACQSGDAVAATVTCDLTAQNNGAYPRLQIQCFDASGNQLTPSGNSDVPVNTAVNTFQTASALAVMPANAVSFRIFVYANASAGFTFLLLNPRVSVNDVRVAGSGARVGDQRNLPNSISVGLGWSRNQSYVLSATSAGALSVVGHTLSLGGAPITYNAASSAITGLTQGSTYTIYTRDNYAGGSPTYQAMNTSTGYPTYDDAYVLGKITVPSTGTNTGGLKQINASLS